MVQWCKELEMHILNGATPGRPAPFTCRTVQGASVVDYVLCRDAHVQAGCDAEVLKGQSDHVLQTVTVPVSC